MAWEIFVTSDSRRRGAGSRIAADDDAPVPEPAVGSRRFWAGLQSLVGRVRNLV